MYLQSLSALNYKNLAQVDLDLCKGLNCFIGNNGMGKTNVLDAIYYLAFGKSRTCHADTQVIRHDEPFMMLQGTFLHASTPEVISVGVKRGQKKSIKRNQKEYERLADHIGLIPLVIVTPDDAELVTEGSSERRKLIDGVISQYDPVYLNDLLAYNKAVLQRNTLLRAHQLDPDLMSVCEGMMGQYAAKIYPKRLAFLQEFIPLFSAYYSKIAAENETVDIHYKTTMEDGDLAQQLAANRIRDEYIGYTTKGIHKDELEFFLGDYPLKRVGSQGQTKTFLIALKLAQFEFIKKAKDRFPILLLDDIFDKLDAERVSRIMRLVAGSQFGQIFITDTNREHLDTLLAEVEGETRLFHVQEGGVQ